MFLTLHLPSSLAPQVLLERSLLATLNHPFVLKLVASYESTSSLYFVLELVQGGEIMSIIQNEKRLPCKHAAFYTACVVAALEYMHSFGECLWRGR